MRATTLVGKRGKEEVPMPDMWSTFPELDAAVQERLAGVLETRGADPQQRAVRLARSKRRSS